MSSENQINHGYLRSTLMSSFFYILGEFDRLVCYKAEGRAREGEYEEGK